LQRRSDQTATLATFKGPALILMGAQDRLCPRDRHDQMQALMPQSHLAIVPDAGHLPTLENPSATAAHLLGWLSS
jgi:pimeloyl-ACP methyl ester carboxylesterase